MRNSKITKRSFLAALSASVITHGTSVKSAIPKAGLGLSDYVTLVGQSIIVGFKGTKPGDPGVEAVAEQIDNATISGVLLLGHNIVSPEQLKELTSCFLSRGTTTPLICVDQEGGRVQRLRESKGFQGWEAPYKLHEVCSRDLLNYYRPRALELAEHGINMNFAPVVDLNVNHNNPVIGALGRSFSKNPDDVTAYARAVVNAHNEASVFTSLKHFPGHGSAFQDSHLEVPVVTEAWKELELLPFANLIEENLANTIMMAHLYHPDFSDGVKIPSSLSARAHKVLRHDLGYDGVIVSDDLHMNAIMGEYSEEEAAIAAVRSGSDLLIFSTYNSPNPTIGPRINKALSAAVLSGAIELEQVEKSYARVEQLKRCI